MRRSIPWRSPALLTSLVLATSGLAGGFQLDDDWKMYGVVMGDELSSAVRSVFREAQELPVPPGHESSSDLEIPRSTPIPERDLRPPRHDTLAEVRLLDATQDAALLMLQVERDTLDEVQGVLDQVRVVRSEIEGKERSPVRIRLLADSVELLRELDIRTEEIGAFVEVGLRSPLGLEERYLGDTGVFVSARVDGAAVPQVVAIETHSDKQISRLPAEVREHWGDRTLLPSVGGQAGNRAGNLLGLPTGTLIVGDSVSADFREHWAQLGFGEQMLEVETGWMRSPLLDGHLAVLPDATAPGGFVIAYADPLAGIELLESLRPKDLLSQFEAAARNATAYSWRNRESVPKDSIRFQQRLARVALLHSYVLGVRSGPSAKWGEKLLSENHRAGVAIQKNLESLRVGLEERLGAPPVFLGLPSLWEDSDGRGLRPLLPSPTQLISIGRHPLVPDPALPVLRDAITARLGERGIHPHLVGGWTYHWEAGHLSAACLVLRGLEPSAPDGVAPERPHQESLFERLHGSID
jgi:hypothetical protein